VSEMVMLPFTDFTESATTWKREGKKTSWSNYVCIKYEISKYSHLSNKLLCYL